MGIWKLIKLSYSSVEAQKELEWAMDNRDAEKAKRIIGDYITRVLENGLTKRQQGVFEKAWNSGRNAVKERLIGAFQRGWAKKPGATSFSDALAETLLEAEKIIKENK
jgi:hypothetical protein